MLYGAETWRVRAVKSKRLKIFEMKYLRSIAGVTLRDWIINDVVRFRTGMVKKLKDRVDTCAQTRHKGDEGRSERT